MPQGFLGAFGSTLVFSLVFANFLATRPFFYCPVESLTLYQLDVRRGAGVVKGPGAVRQVCCRG